MEYEMEPSYLTATTPNFTYNSNSSGDDDDFNCSGLGDISFNHTSLFDIEIPYYTVTTLTSLLSILGCAFILYYYYTIEELQNRSRQLLVFLTICDFGIAAGNIYGIIIILSTGGYLANDDQLNFIAKNSSLQIPSCFIQGLICSGFSVASFLWTSVIGLNVYMIVNHNYRLLVDNYYWLIHIICWGIPIAVVCVTGGMNRYGYNPCGDESIWYCWVTPVPYDYGKLIMWQLISGKFWELISYFLVLALYLSAYCKLKNFNKRTAISSQSGDSPLVASQSTSYTLANKKLTLIPLVFILTRVWGTMRFLLLIGYRKKLSGDIGAALAPFQGIGDSAQGFLNCLVFMYTTPCLQGRFPMKYLMKKTNQVTCSHHHTRRDEVSAREQTGTIARGSSSTGTSSDSDDEVNHIQVIKQYSTD